MKIEYAIDDRRRHEEKKVEEISVYAMRIRY